MYINQNHSQTKYYFNVLLNFNVLHELLLNNLDLELVGNNFEPKD